MPANSSSASLCETMASIVGVDACLSSPEELFVYECDAFTLGSARPALVVLPGDTHQVSQVVKACRRFGRPFVPRGAGTSLAGGAHPIEGAVIIECSRMKRILSIDAVDRIAVVQPGVVNADLSEEAAPYGLFYAPDPSSQQACTIGGNVAANSGGAHTLKYGTTTNHVLALEMVLPDGEIVRLGSPTGFAGGYDLVGAVVGSEGTTGVVTEITVRLVPLPESVETLLAVFPDVVAACHAVGRIIRSGLVPVALEILDQRIIQIVEDSVFAAGLPRDAGAVLLLELDGAASALRTEAESVRRMIAESGAREVRVARDAAEREQFWKGRKGAFGAIGRLAPDLYVHDGVVPRSKLPEVLTRVCEIGDRYGLVLSNVFHAGDGNLHPIISFDRRDPVELERVEAAGAEILKACVEVGGVITGEHGVGTEKRDFIHLVFAEPDLEVMRWLRSAFDPDGVSNPEKVFPPSRSNVETTQDDGRGPPQ